MPSKVGNYQAKRPNLTREGASLRKAVRGELEWTRSRTHKAASEAMRERATKTACASDTYRKS